MIKVYTVSEVAEMFKVCQKHIYSMTRSGKLPCFKVGGAIRFTEEHILSFMNGATTSSK